MASIARYVRRRRFDVEFLHITRDGTTLIVARGLRGTPGTTEIRSFDTEEEVASTHARLSSEVMQQGYRWIGYGPPPADELTHPVYARQRSPFPGAIASPAAEAALTGVDDVDWAELGPGCENTEDVLRAAGSADPAVAQAATDHLGLGGIYHDGYVHENAPAAIRFLVALASTFGVHHRAQILSFAAQLSLHVFDGEELPGWPMSRDHAGAVAMLGPEHPYVRVHDAIAADRAQLHNLLTDDDPGVRCGAALVLGTLREYADEVRAPLLGRLAATNDVERAAIVVALGCLADAETGRALAQLDHQAREVRAAVALALAVNGLDGRDPAAVCAATRSDLKAVNALVPVYMALRVD